MNCPEMLFRNTTEDGLGVDGELILERRGCYGVWRCCGVVSLKEDEMRASEFGVVDSEGLELCDGVSESEWISVEELLDLVGMRPFERGEEDGNDGMCGLGLGDGDVNGCGRGKRGSSFQNKRVIRCVVKLYPYRNADIAFHCNLDFCRVRFVVIVTLSSASCLEVLNCHCL